MKKIGRWIARELGDKWPELLVLLLIAAVLTGMATQKEGYHMDELLSFELSNAEFNPWIVPTQPVGRLAKLEAEEIEPKEGETTLGNVFRLAKDWWQNRGNSVMATFKADVYHEPVWIDRETFRDYLTVNDRDDFQYLSVYFNVKDDNHPPLHFMVLHTMSSLMKEQINPLMGFVINLAAILAVCGLMMHLGRFMDRQGVYEPQMAEGKWGIGRMLGMGAALCYGTSGGAIATSLLIRMYGLLTLWCVLTLVIILKKWMTQGFESNNKGLIAVTLLGFWTQYFYLFYCLTLALLLSILFWRTKRFREWRAYVVRMLMAAVMGIAIFPFAVGDVLFSGRGMEAVANLAEGIGGYGSRLGAFGLILARSMVAVGNPEGGELLVPACLGGGLVAAAAFSLLRRKPYVTLMLVPAAGYFFLAARMSPYEVDRYIMPVFPFLYMALFFGWGGLAVTKRRGLITCLGLVGAIALGVWNIRNYSGEYWYRGYGLQEKVAEKYSELPAVCVYEGVGYYENLMEFLHYDKTLLVTPKELAERSDQESLQEADRIVVLIKEEVDPVEVEGVLKETYDLHPVKRLVEESVYGDEVWLYGKE